VTRYIQRPNDLHRDLNLERGQVDAIQWTGDNLNQLREEFPEAQARLIESRVWPFRDDTNYLAVEVAGGGLFLHLMWWLVRAEGGCVHAMWPGPFAESYEPVGEPTVTIPVELVPCRKPDCDHLVRSTVAYCCLACARADEHRYEIHDSGPLGHSSECLARHRERGPAGRR